MSTSITGNKLGWLDPSAEFSTRQNSYADAFGRDSVYTPRMIVDGRQQFVGSDSSKAREAIMKAARLPKSEGSASLGLAKN